MTVELGYGGVFELEESDADILIRIPGRDVMWQKERLLNLALEAVPASCGKIAYLDCDIIFERPDWAEIAASKLDRAALVHLFDTRLDLPANGAADGGRLLESIGRKIADGRADRASFATCRVRHLLAQSNGLAWAGRREIIERHGLYDACVMGGGDQAIICAGVGRIAEAAGGNMMTPQRHRHYAEWAASFYESVNGSVDYVPGRILHLWHGSLRSRQSSERQRLLGDFDPATDISLDQYGCWRWNSDKPAMHRDVSEYFRERAEAEASDDSR